MLDHKMVSEVAQVQADDGFAVSAVIVALVLIGEQYAAP